MTKYFSSSGGYQGRSTNSRVDPFKDYMCFVVLIMEYQFFILPEGTTFAYIILLKFSFGESYGYLLHNL